MYTHVKSFKKASNQWALIRYSFADYSVNAAQLFFALHKI